MAEVLRVTTGKLKEIVDLTERVQSLIQRAKMREGLCSLFVTHTTAALTTGEIWEGTEQDLLDVVEQIIPSTAFVTRTTLPMPGRIWPPRCWAPPSVFPWRTGSWPWARGNPYCWSNWTAHENEPST